MLIVFYIFVAAAVLQVLYYALLFARVGWVRSKAFVADVLPPVSIVICARNEAANLKKYLKVVLIQQYPQFEVILVNDRSTDNTIDVMVDYYRRNTNVRIVNIEPDEPARFAGKKDALVRGIEIARHEYIVVTDADCRPAGTQWLANLVSTYQHKTQLVLGYSPYEKGGGFAQQLMRYEHFMASMQYIGYALAGLPYMGVGRNLSYKKELFKEGAVYNKTKHLPTGDDDLLVNHTANAANTAVCLSKEAFMYTPAPPTLGAWLNAKRRHLRSGFKYKWYHQVLLFLFALSLLLFYVGFAAMFFYPAMLLYAGGIFVLTAVLKLFLSIPVYRKLEAVGLMWLSPVLDIWYAGYLLIIFLLLLLKPKNSWT